MIHGLEKLIKKLHEKGRYTIGKVLALPKAYCGKDCNGMKGRKSTILDIAGRLNNEACLNEQYMYTKWHCSLQLLLCPFLQK